MPKQFYVKRLFLDNPLERLIGAVDRALERARVEPQRKREDKERVNAERRERKRSEGPIAPVAVVTPSPARISTPAVEEQLRSFLGKATKEHPWINSLGMTFVPVA